MLGAFPGDNRVHLSLLSSSNLLIMLLLGSALLVSGLPQIQVMDPEQYQQAIQTNPPTEQKADNPSPDQPAQQPVLKQPPIPIGQTSAISLRVGLWWRKWPVSCSSTAFA